MLQPGGYIMFRESHLHRNINVATPKGHPTHYRRLVVSDFIWPKHRVLKRGVVVLGFFV